ncbi:hypothetical protein V6N13_110611 [Hibiscus sabdariffa]
MEGVYSSFILLHIGELRSHDWKVRLAHVRRGGNKVSDSKAKPAMFDSFDMMQFPSPPLTNSSIMSFVLADVEINSRRLFDTYSVGHCSFMAPGH